MEKDKEKSYIDSKIPVTIDDETRRKQDCMSRIYPMYLWKKSIDSTQQSQELEHQSLVNSRGVVPKR